MTFNQALYQVMGPHVTYDRLFHAYDLFPRMMVKPYDWRTRYGSVPELVYVEAARMEFALQDTVYRLTTSIVPQAALYYIHDPLLVGIDTALLYLIIQKVDGRVPANVSIDLVSPADAQRCIIMEYGQLKPLVVLHICNLVRPAL